MRAVIITLALITFSAQKPADPLAEAKERLLAGNYAEARALFDKQIPGNPLAYCGLQRAMRAEGEYTRAIEVLNEGLKKHADNLEIQACLADALYEVGKWDEASVLVAKVLKAKDDHFLAHWTKARILRDRGELAEADQAMRWFVRTYTAASNADKEITDPEALLLIGQAAAENARWNRLPDQFRFIMRYIYRDDGKTRKRWEPEYLSGLLLLEKFNRPEAVEAFDDALKWNPSAAEAFVGKGQAAFIKYEMKDAEQFAHQALKINPNLRPALQLLADVQFRGGDLVSAEKNLVKARGVNPRDPVTLGKLAGLYLIQKKQAEFDQVVKTAESFDSKPSQFYLEVADYLDDRKLYTQAEVYFKKSTDLRPKLAAPLAGLGMLYLRMGKEKEGREILDKAFLADKFNVRVANMRKVLDHLDKYSLIKTEHYELKYNPETDKLLAEFLAEYLEETHKELKEKFGYEPPGLTPVQVFSKHEMFSGRTTGLPDLHTIGASTGKIIAMASPHATGIAKPFNWGRVLRHELVHVFNLTQTEFQCPHWLTEGLAVQQEKMALPTSWIRTLRDRYEEKTLLNLDTILMGFVRPRSPDEWGLAYCQSKLYVDYLIQSHGTVAVGKMLEAYRKGLDTNQALKSTCGVDQATFEKGYLAHVEQVLKPYRTRAGKTEAKPEKTLTFDELTEASKKNPDDIEISAKLAEQLLRRGKVAEARKLVDAVLEKKKSHPLASVIKARLLSRGGDDEAARTLLEDALKDAPDDTRLMMIVARYLLETKEYEKAATILEKGRKMAPLDGDWLESLVQVYTETKKTEKLVDVLKEVVSHDPDELTGRIKLARTSLEAKLYKDAEYYAWESIRIDVQNADARALLVEALKANGKAELAAKMSKRFEE